uniref:Uncharacterized protein n=1 Tax=Neisseria meningitidis alpha522 TaxID=996307 RepID=I4E6D0_NEIME|nr:hypothetical protein NMALPHA522_1357 [Neisseria meningitidis alpha522]
MMGFGNAAGGGKQYAFACFAFKLDFDGACILVLHRCSLSVCGHFSFFPAAWEMPSENTSDGILLIV